MNDLRDMDLILKPNQDYDLTSLRDDKTVLKNPHKGWYVHYVDNGFTRPFYRDSIPAGDHLEGFPGINHLYIRFDWQDIEPAEGYLNWQPIDDIIREWSPYGYRFALRLCTYEVNSHLEYATPAWVRAAGAQGRRIERISVFDRQPECCWEPDYADPIFLAKLENLMRAYGGKYNGHPLIEFVDVGTFGTFGEGHTSGGRQYDAAVIKRHIDLHTRYFPDTRLLVNDDMIRHPAGGEQAAELARYCAGLGLGIRDDSALVAGCARDNGYDTLRAPRLFDEFWADAPVDIECQHQRFITKEIFRDGYPFLAALSRAHATYAGFHGAVDDWLRDHGFFHERVANLLGYWYFIDGIKVSAIKSGENGSLTLSVTNAGFAPAYHDYELIVRLTDPKSGGISHIAARLCGVNRRWLPDITNRLTIEIGTQPLPAGKYYLELGLFDGRTPVWFAIKSDDRTDDGFYRIGVLSIQP